MASYAYNAQAVVSRGTVKELMGQAPAIEFVEGEFIIQMHQGELKSSRAASMNALQAQLKALGMKIVEHVNAREGLVLAQSLSIGKTLALANIVTASSELQSAQALVKVLAGLKGVAFAEPNYLYRALDIQAEPNDPNFSQLWGMKNVGQADSDGVIGKAGSDIKALQAWGVTKGSKDVVVAIIDTGVDYNHPDLRDNIWSQPGNPNVHGYNAITNTTDPMDDNNHGTHCAGTIGAAGDNNLGVVGVNWNVSIMGSKFLAANGSGSTANAIKAIDWAVQNGAKVLSNSWGGGAFSQALKDAIQRANDRGVIFIAAAGNSATNLDTAPSYPASYDVPNVIAVGASTNLDTLASFSSYGARSVLLVAPGHNIVSTIPGNRYDSFSGTSMATPHVSGAVALLMAHDSSLNMAQIKARLAKSSDKSRSLRTRASSAGRLNVYNLLMDLEGPGFVQIPDTAWSSLVVRPVASAHPYPNNSNQRWEISHPGARYLRLHFTRFATEQGYDSVKIISAATNEVVDTFTGTLANGFWTSEIEGSKAIIQIESDNTVNGWGFDVDGYSWTNYGAPSVNASLN